MKNYLDKDIGEEIIFQLKEINLLLEKIMEERRNGKECSSASCS